MPVVSTWTHLPLSVCADSVSCLSSASGLLGRGSHLSRALVPYCVVCEEGEAFALRGLASCSRVGGVVSAVELQRRADILVTHNI